MKRKVKDGQRYQSVRTREYFTVAYVASWKGVMKRGKRREDPSMIAVMSGRDAVILAPVHRGALSELWELQQ